MEFQSEQGFVMGIKNYPCSKAQMHSAMVQNAEISCSKYRVIVPKHHAPNIETLCCNIMFNIEMLYSFM